jgi:hypothetical protein
MTKNDTRKKNQLTVMVNDEMLRWLQEQTGADISLGDAVRDCIRRIANVQSTQIAPKVDVSTAIDVLQMSLDHSKQPYNRENVKVAIQVLKDYQCK